MFLAALGRYGDNRSWGVMETTAPKCFTLQGLPWKTRKEAVMPDLHAFPRGHLLSDLSGDNQARVAAYLTLLQARHYAPGTLDDLISALKSFWL